MKRKLPPSLSLFDEPPPKPRDRQPRDTAGLPKGLSPDDYDVDDDGHVRELVGTWARDKHARLEKYVHISAATRKKWLRPGAAGAAYIDLFSGPGRCRVKDTDTVIPGSPVVAWRKAVERGSGFSRMIVADARPSISDAIHHRLASDGAPVEAFVGTADATVEQAVSAVDKRGLHLAFLDPYDLISLPFDVIRKLARLDHVDIMIHVSLQDLTRNLRRYILEPHSALDVFAPGWRTAVDVEMPDARVRSELFQHWRGLLKTIGMQTTEAAELVSGPSNQPLYWLAFAARHPLALRFWNDVRDLGGQSDYLRAI